MASLTVVVDGVEQKIPLETASVTLGRGLESDVRLKDIKASRRHCQVQKAAKGYQCVDLSSGNGTYVNGIQIKTQPLSHGDKIMIGSTTIVFEDAPRPAAVSSKAPTAKIPVAAAPAPAAAAAGKGSGKVATAKVPVAPTRRTTERVEAAAKAPAPKSGPISAVKPGGRPGKPAGRTSSLRPPRTASAEAPAKKKSPALIAAAVVAVVLALGGGAWYFVAGRDNGDQVKDQVEQLMKKGRAAEAQEHLDAALAEYRKALDLCQGDRYKIKASEISKLIAQLESRKAGATPPPPAPGVKEPVEKTDPFPAKKAEIADKYKTGGEAGGDWAGALKEWTEFAGRKPAPDSTARAQAEIKALQAKARAELTRLRKKADALAKENKMAEAVDLLKQQSSRFEGTDVQPDLEAAVKQYDK